MSAEKVQSANHLNTIRLFLAVMVILGHSPGLIDGDRSREILTRAFYTLSLGELAVACFFILSGYLIVKSWSHTPDLQRFAVNRALRIYPGFTVACLVSAFIFAPLGGDAFRYFAAFNYPLFFKSIVLLQMPVTPYAFQGNHYPFTNGSLWTIQYEVFCYAFTALCGIVRLLQRGRYFIGMFVLTLATYTAATIRPELSVWLPNLIACRFLMLFLAGACFYKFEDKIPRNLPLLAAAVIAVIACFTNRMAADLALAVCGPYVLFYVSQANIPLFKQIGRLPDVSYGVYLYAWPIQQLIIWHLPGISPWLLFPLALAGALVCGYISYTFVEAPMLKLKRKKRPEQDAFSSKIPVLVTP